MAVRKTAGRRRRIRNPEDLVSGVVIIAVALFAFWAASDLPGMRGIHFGPGTAPRILTSLLLCIGVAITILSLLRDGAGLPSFTLRGPLIVTASVLVFAVAVRPLGLLPTTFIAFLVASAAVRETRWIETIVAGLAMSALTAFIFLWALEIPFEPWPRFITRGLSYAL